MEKTAIMIPIEQRKIESIYGYDLWKRQKDHSYAKTDDSCDYLFMVPNESNVNNLKIRNESFRIRQFGEGYSIIEPFGLMVDTSKIGFIKLSNTAIRTSNNCELPGDFSMSAILSIGKNESPVSKKEASKQSLEYLSAIDNFGYKTLASITLLRNFVKFAIDNEWETINISQLSEHVLRYRDDKKFAKVINEAESFRSEEDKRTDDERYMRYYLTARARFLQHQGILYTDVKRVALEPYSFMIDTGVAKELLPSDTGKYTEISRGFMFNDMLKPTTIFKPSVGKLLQFDSGKKAW